MTTRCPTCGHIVTPVYCAASIPERPLLLAWTQRQAAAALGIDVDTVRVNSRPWCDGRRLVRQHCRWCGGTVAPRQRYAHEQNCLSNPARRGARSA